MVLVGCTDFLLRYSIQVALSDTLLPLVSPSSLPRTPAKLASSLLRPILLQPERSEHKDRRTLRSLSNKSPQI